MARIRTIKPDFFTSADVVSLSPLARLLFIALLCEADREGRMVWRPETFKLRYLPADRCNIEALCREIIERGMVRTYGDGLAWIPTFVRHQHLNPRESASVLPAPPQIDASVTREDASRTVPHAQGGREGKEGKGKEITPLPPLPAAKGEISKLEMDWRIEEVWSAHLRQWERFFASKTGVVPGARPTLTKEIRESIRAALLEHDRDLLAPEKREDWKRTSKARGAGIGIFLDDWCNGTSTDNDANNGGKRYLEHWRPWKRQRGKGDPVDRFAELYFHAKEVQRVTSADA